MVWATLKFGKFVVQLAVTSISKKSRLLAKSTTKTSKCVQICSTVHTAATTMVWNKSRKLNLQQNCTKHFNYVATPLITRQFCDEERGNDLRPASRSLPLNCVSDNADQWSRTVGSSLARTKPVRWPLSCDDTHVPVTYIQTVTVTIKWLHLRNRLCDVPSVFSVCGV